MALVVGARATGAARATVRSLAKVSRAASTLQAREPYWQSIPRWRDISEQDFISYAWQCKHSVQTSAQLSQFLREVLPGRFALQQLAEGQYAQADQDGDATTTAEAFVADVQAGLKRAPMAIRLTPHVLSCVDWRNPFDDPVRRQFIPLGSAAQPDHPQLSFDSLHEVEDSPVKGLVHRYPDKALFLATSVCPVYCRFCTRSYAVGNETEAASKTRYLPIQKKWEPMFEYLAQTSSVHDVVVSGGDALTLDPAQITMIGERLLALPNIRRIRFASKGVAVCPSRIIDPNDKWASALIGVSNAARQQGKTVALHTHFNHPNEVSWITRSAMKKLFSEGLTVRNQTVLLNGVNDDLQTTSELIHLLADLNIQPYYVYQADMVNGLEDLRTPLHRILELESHIRGTIAGFLTPSFVVDLPGGGGKRLACSYQDYDRLIGVATFEAPGVKGKQTFQYFDPVWSLPKEDSTNAS